MNPDAGTRGELRLLKAWYGLGALMLAGVAVISLVPVPDTGVGDKFSHVLTYAVLGCWFGLLAPNRAALLWTVAGLTLFGMLLEVLQGLTNYRYAEWADVGANAAGTLVGVLLHYTPLRRALALVDRGLARVLSG